MLRFAIAKTFGATLFFFFGTVFVMGFKLWKKKWGRKKKQLQMNRYSTMHKVKINFCEVEGLENISFCFRRPLNSG